MGNGTGYAMQLICKVRVAVVSYTFTSHLTGFKATRPANNPASPLIFGSAIYNWAITYVHVYILVCSSLLLLGHTVLLIFHS